MPIWIELLVSLLIVYGCVVTLTMVLFSRRVRLTRLLKLRAARDFVGMAAMRPGTSKEEESNG